MDESVFQQPTAEQLQQFVAGDPVAMDEVLALVLPQLYIWAERRYSNVPEQERVNVLHDVLNETYQHHDRYNPRLTKFTTYIINLIIKRMATVQRQQIKRSEQEESLESLSEKHREIAYNNIEADTVRRIDRENFYRHVRSQLSEIELAFLDLMLAGENRQQAFIAILEASGNTTAPSKDVKNVKERVKYKVNKIAQMQGLSLEDVL